MPARLRTYAESTQSEHDTLLTLDGFPNSRVSNDRNTHAPSNLPRQSIKRRKTCGINLRFDRMIDTVSILHTSPASSTLSRRSRRRAASSSSVASYDMPKTPVDAYSGIDNGRLGQGFSVLKMKGPTVPARQNRVGRHQGDIFASSSIQSDSAMRPLPSWLCDTLSTLDPRHPLRILLPANAASDSTSPMLDIQPHNHHIADATAPVDKSHIGESVFAFSVPQGANHSYDSPGADIAKLDVLDISTKRSRDERFLASNPAPSHADDIVEATCRNESSTAHLLLDPAPPVLDDRHFPTSVNALPFSTPGPASVLSTVLPTNRSVPIAAAFPAALSSNLLEAQDDEDVIELAPFSRPGPLIRTVRPAQPNFLAVSELPAYVAFPLSSPRSTIVSQASSSYEGDEVHVAVNASPFAHSHSELFCPLRSPVVELSVGAMSHDITLSPQYSSHVHLLPSSTRPHTEVTPLPVPFIPFTAPGPAHPSRTRPARASPFKVYFDTPADDPCASDPVEVADYALPLDYQSEGEGEVNIEALGFKWERFDRGSKRRRRRSEDMFADSVTDSHIGELHGAPPSPPAAASGLGRSSSLLPGWEYTSATNGYDVEKTEDEFDLEADADFDKTFAWIVSPRDSAFASPGSQPREPMNHYSDEGDVLPASPPVEDATVRGDEKEISPPRGLPFAPAPGIYISPLRGSAGLSQDTDHEMQRPEGERVEHLEGKATVPLPATPKKVVHRQQAEVRKPPHKESSDADAPKQRERQSTDEIEQCSDTDTKGKAFARDILDDVEGDGHEMGYSQESTETIESWTEVDASKAT
ncbi:hypothetical protein A0H81_11985 [Grifola frondosa]|uniref:Uncharacterized protein n=1 Tax=Grifola frondosa TaxID=5627 RepID=A0A1C7LTS1_GRIFR|nr:hypothetical protein A0H81_11985 [Grifola frondosa]